MRIVPQQSFDFTTPAAAAPGRARRARKARTLAADEVCHNCSKELAVFWQGRAYCIHCESDALFGEVADHQRRAAGMAREASR